AMTTGNTMSDDRKEFEAAVPAQAEPVAMIRKLETIWANYCSEEAISDGGELMRELDDGYDLLTIIELLRTAVPTQPDEVAIPVVDCPHCPNQGFEVVADSYGEAEQSQCEFCYCTPNSRFNVNEILKSALAKGERE